MQCQQFPRSCFDCQMMRSDLLVVFSCYRVFLRDRPNGKFVVFHTLICVILKTEYVLGGVFWKSFGDRTVFWYFVLGRWSKCVCRVVCFVL